MFHALILAGGDGTRLWPVSRKNSPKQIGPFLDSQTLLQKTYQRIKKIFPENQIWLACNIDHCAIIKKQLPSFSIDNFSLESEKKNTAAAIGLATLKIYQRDSDAVFVIINSDAWIKDEKEYLRILKLAEKINQKYPDYTLSIGVKPNYPEIGYGYIKIGKLAEKIGKDKIYQVEKFVEKPNLATAKKYVKNKRYFWNPTLFVWRADYLLSLYQKYQPKIYQGLAKIRHALNSKDENKVIVREFEKMPSISIDYGIIEKTKKMLCVPVDFGWTDIGNWKAVKNVLNSGKKNIATGKYISVDSKNNLIYNKKLVATIGVKNMIIVETEGAILICPDDRAQEVKKIVEKLDEEYK